MVRVGLLHFESHLTCRHNCKTQCKHCHFPKKEDNLQSFKAQLQALTSLFSIGFRLSSLTTYGLEEIDTDLVDFTQTITRVGHSFSNMQNCNVNLHNTNASRVVEIMKFALASKKVA